MKAWIVKRALSEPDTDKLREDLASSCVMKPGAVGHGSADGGSNVVEMIRKSPIAFPDTKCDLLRERFETLEKAVLGWNERNFGFDVDPSKFSWQYTTYSKGGDFYKLHCDCSFDRKDGIMRKLSGSLLLSDPTEKRGGKFGFSDGYPLAPEIGKGQIIVFCSFAPHAVSPIIKGARESLVFWLEGPDFK